MRRRLGRATGRRRTVAAALLVAAALTAVFVWFALASGPHSALSAWDRRVSDAFIAWRAPGRSQLFWALTLLGDTPLLSALSFSTVLLLAVWRRWTRALLVSVGLLMAWGISEVAKAAVGRARPPAGGALIAVPTSGGLPSGHALTTLVFLGLLVYMAFGWQKEGAPRRTDHEVIHRAGPRDSRAGGGRSAVAPGSADLKSVAALGGAGLRRAGAARVALLAGIVMTVLIGLSRVYLGVHWTSDVLGGWCLGGAWLVVLFGGVGRYVHYTHPFMRIDMFLSRRRSPARPVWRVAAVAFVVVLCIAAVVMSAKGDPLLAEL